MGNLASPLHLAAVAGAIGWPLAAGLGLVYWSRARSAAHARKVAALNADLQGLYSELKTKPVPARLHMVVDALEEADALKPTKGAVQRGAAPSSAKS